VTISVVPSGLTTAEVRVIASSDDAEESASGSVSLGSSDLELVYDGSNQTVGIRFRNVPIPAGSVIHNAYVQFQVDEANSVTTALTIRGEASDNPATFTSGGGNVSSRPRTAASTPWSPAGWPTVGQAGPEQRTPSIAEIVQEIVRRVGWASGNALALILTGSGKRVAEAYDGSAAAAPLLHIEYAPPTPNTAPTASNVAVSGTAQVGQVLTGTYTYADAEGDPEGTSTYRWLRGTTPISGATARTYTLVSADQGALIRFEVTPVAASGTSPGAAVASAAVGPVAAAVVVSVTAITPNTLGAGTSTSATITGSGFAPGASVLFEGGAGATPTATNVVVTGGGTVTATVSVKSGGPRRNRVWNVRVTNSDGSTGVLAGGLTVTP
jgi:hypothetical protein